MILLLEIYDKDITRAFTIHKKGTSDYDITLQRIKQYIIMYTNIEIKDIVDRLIKMNYNSDDSRIINNIKHLSEKMTEKATLIDNINLCSNIDLLQEMLTANITLKTVDLD